MSMWKKVKGIFIPVVAVVTTGAIYLNRSFFKRKAMATAGLALMNPGTTMMALMIVTDPIVFWVSSNVVLMLWRGTWSAISKYF